MQVKSGFTLIQLSIILTVASLIFVATLPGIQSSLKASAASVTKMNSILNTMRGYMAANGVLPCPADPTQAIGASNYGVAAANPGTTNNCTGGSPAAAYVDSTNHIAIGMVPVKTLGLSYADALDGYGRDITYAVDTNATATCWSSSSLTGAITVNDNGINYNTVAALVSHGADGYGAWLPLSGTSGTASRFDNGSTDTNQAANAQVATGGGLTPNTTFVSFIRQAATSTFDDNVVYKSNLYTLNTLPTSAQAYPTVTPPANGTYTTGNILTFTLTYAVNVTVTGTPRLDLSALGTGSIGTGNVAYATYQSGSGSTTLTFSYTVQSTDSAPTSGLTMNAWIDLNGGTISGGSTCFTAPNLTAVLISSGNVYVADGTNNRIQKLDTSGNYVAQYTLTNLLNPSDVAIDSSGNMWVADYQYNSVWKLSSSGAFILGIGAGYQGVSGTQGSSGTGTGQFNLPYGIAIDSNGGIFVSDENNNRIEKFNSSGTYLYSIPSSGTGSGAALGKFKGIHHIAIDASNNIWVADAGNNRLQEFSNSGTFIQAVGGGSSPFSCQTSSTPSCASGSGNGQFNDPKGITVDPSGNIWVADTGNNRVQEFTSSGVFVTSWSNSFNGPSGISAKGSYIWVSDTSNSKIDKCTAAGSCTAYGSSGVGNGQFKGADGLTVTR